MLIRKEMVLVIMSTLIMGDDNEQYYFYAMFCVGDPCFQCSLNGKHSHEAGGKSTGMKVTAPHLRAATFQSL